MHLASNFFASVENLFCYSVNAIVISECKPYFICSLYQMFLGSCFIGESRSLNCDVTLASNVVNWPFYRECASEIESFRISVHPFPVQIYLYFCSHITSATCTTAVFFIISLLESLTNVEVCSL